MTAARSESRDRGRIEERATGFRVVVYAGVDPVTGKRVYLRETIKGTTDAARKRAEKALTKLLNQVNEQNAAPLTVALSYALDEWLRTSELEESTHHTYEGYIKRTIRPALGETPVSKITPRVLESFYSELRRCRTRCDGKPRIDKHAKSGEHDCAESGCKPHICKPMGSSTIRQIHAILSGTLDAAQRWEWISSNPARIARKPKQKRPEPDPPTPAEAAQLSEKAFKMDEDWGTLVWLAMTTGMRRGEIAAHRFARADLEEEVIDLRRNWVRGVEKGTKTHQNRRIALDSETVTLLKEHKARVRERIERVGATFSESTSPPSPAASATAAEAQPHSACMRRGSQPPTARPRRYSVRECLSGITKSALPDKMDDGYQTKGDKEYKRRERARR